MAGAAPAALPSGYRHEAHGSLPSTNAEAFARARAGADNGLWITADEQTAGKGRRGRVWDGGRGNLAASLLLVDPAPSSEAATLSFVAGVALHQAVVDLAGPSVVERLSLKWPNDLLLDRQKVAGILIEGEALAERRFAAVIGIGVNCVSHPAIGGPVPSGSFAGQGVPVESAALFARLAERVASEIRRWDRGSGFAAIRSAWLARAGGIGEPIRVNLPGGSVDGRFEDIDAVGRLVLVKADGARETFSAGDVFFAPAKENSE